jgi:predicted Zn-dependent peptidase
MISGKRRASSGAFLSFLLSALLCLSGRGQPPPSGEGLPQKSTLDNGLSVILDIDESSPTTFLQILVKGGKRAEPAGQRGLSFLATRLSVEIPDSGKVQELMSLATRFSVTVLGDYSFINVECLTENLEASLKVLSKIILDPLFSGIRIDAVKKHMEHQSLIEEDDSVRLGHLACLGAFFSGTPYEGSVYGDKESLKAIKNRDVADFYERYFIGPNMILALSSDLSVKELLDLVGKYFAKIPEGEPISFGPVSASHPEERAVRIDRETKQTYVGLSYPLPEVSARNFALASVLENLLGKGPGSRLWTLRAEKKLAYNVNCLATQMQSGGVIEAYLETDHPKMENAKTVLWQTILELHQHGISAEELASTKTAAVADFIRENETKTGKVATLGYFESVGLGPTYFSAFSSEIEALTLDEVNAYIRSILAPEMAFEVVIGSKSGEE